MLDEVAIGEADAQTGVHPDHRDGRHLDITGKAV
jgi:hypothetical protein